MDDNLNRAGAAFALWNEHVADVAKRAKITKSRAIALSMRDPIGRRLWALAKGASGGDRSERMGNT